MDKYVLDDNKYYESRNVITYLENVLKKDFDSIKLYVHSSGINVTEEQIRIFLNKKLMEENPKLKKRIEYSKSMRNCDICYLIDEDINVAVQEIMNPINIGRYRLEPYVLEYFNKYVNILKFKIDKLFDIIKSIGTKTTEGINDILDDLDIILDDNGNILGSDIVRLVDTIIYNINTLSEKIRTANNFNTYLSCKLSEDKIYKIGLYEGEIYPSKKLQIKNFPFCHISGYVPLTKNQMENIMQEQNENVKVFTNTIWDDLYD